MSGKLKEIQERIKAVTDTEQITKAMKMVAAVKLRRAQEAIIEMRPYANRLKAILADVLPAAQGEVSISLAEQRDPKNIVFLLITSSRGLCGAFNSSLIKLTNRTITEEYAEQAKNNNVRIICIGKKGYDFFKKTDFDIVSDHLDLINELSFDKSIEIVEGLIEDFTEKRTDEVRLVYSQFQNAATQVFVNEQFLPLQKLVIDEGGEKSENHDYIFEPNTEQIMIDLVPYILKAQFYKALLDSHASEHGARMTAMDKATENANDLIKELRLTFNRARQEEVTSEILEIVGGANALENA
ncbi:MAG: ATP synthase F1 subunit gamma [Bacteroidetes bacterium]|nr:ATP synthase F1 subunit gamma [Bacteroidota bacterium]